MCVCLYYKILDLDMIVYFDYFFFICRKYEKRGYNDKRKIEIVLEYIRVIKNE